MNQAVLERPGDAIPCEQELIARARALIPTLRARSKDCEKAQMVPAETIADFEAAGFFRILQPAAFGGYELPPTTFYRVLHEIGSGCPSSAWVLMVVGVHNWEVALLPPKVGEDLWAEDDRVRTSSSYVPFGRAEKVEGGYRLSGRWRFSSGSDHCTWAFLGAFVTNLEGSVPEWRIFVVPRSDYEVVQGTWDVFGLSGSGSKDIDVPGTFVPDYRTHSFLEAQKSENEGLSTFTSPNFKYPFGTVFHYAVASVVLGMAHGALALAREQLSERRDNFAGEKVSGNPLLRRRVAEADAAISAVRALLFADLGEMADFIAKEEPIPSNRRAQYAWHAAYLGRQCAEAVTTLFKGFGGRGVLNSNPIQVFLRDIQAGTNHICMDVDGLGVNAGGVLLGADNALLHV